MGQCITTFAWYAWIYTFPSCLCEYQAIANLETDKSGNRQVQTDRFCTLLIVMFALKYCTWIIRVGEGTCRAGLGKGWWMYVDRAGHAVSFMHMISTIEYMTLATCLQHTNTYVMPYGKNRPLKLLVFLGSRHLAYCQCLVSTVAFSFRFFYEISPWMICKRSNATWKLNINMHFMHKYLLLFVVTKRT